MAYKFRALESGDLKMLLYLPKILVGQKKRARQKKESTCYGVENHLLPNIQKSHQHTKRDK